jgi:hypothetical protein
MATLRAREDARDVGEHGSGIGDEEFGGVLNVEGMLVRC